MCYSVKNPCKKPKFDADLLPQTSVRNRTHENVSSDKSVSNDVDIEVVRNKFSCYDVINPNWLESAKELEDCRIYVHRELLEWIVQHIDENILNDILRATVEEVFHHNLDGQVFLIKFYNKKTALQKYYVISKILLIINQLRYKLIWKKRPVYFLRIDSGFEMRKIRIVNKLRKLNLHKRCKAKVLNVNWLYIPKIEIYEFSKLTAAQMKEIDLIFVGETRSQSPLFICKQFSWHKDKAVGDYINTNTLLINICGEAWRRCDLFKDFRLIDILNLDLANKDYRSEYFDEYLDKYIDILLKRIAPNLSLQTDGKLIVDMSAFPEHISQYFVSKYYNKISAWYNNDNTNFINNYDISQIKSIEGQINLRGNEPSPNELSVLITQSRDISYNILNYNYFSDLLFRALLNELNARQKYIFAFDDNFQFIYGTIEQPIKHLNNVLRPVDFKQITIELVDCIEKNVLELEKFVKHCIVLFKQMGKSKTEITVVFKNCMLQDYAFIGNIGSCTDYIKFEEMKIPASQFSLLSWSLAKQKRVEFVNCNDITDTNVMNLLKYIDIDRLNIIGGNSCTAGLFIMMEEYVNGRIRELVEFVKVEDKIIIRDIRTKKTKSVYCITKQPTEEILDEFLDESFDSIYNVYNE